MKRSINGILVLVAFLVVGLLPAALSLAFARSTWTIVASIGATAMAAGLVFEGFRVSQALAAAERREAVLKGAVASLESKVEAANERIREVMTADDVTGVLNRRTFLTRLDEVAQRDARLGKPLAFLLIDVEGFRRINGEKGRVVGDQVLKRVARALQASTRGTDYIGRLGGDEFAIVLGECADPRPAVDRLFVALDGESTEGKDPLPIRVSVGAVIVENPGTGVDFGELFQVAEGALASVRGTGGGLCGRRTLKSESPRVAVR